MIRPSVEEPRKGNATRKISLFMVLLAAAAIPALFHDEFMDHFYFYLTGKSIIIVTRGNWVMVGLNIALFTALLAPLSFRRKVDTAEYGMVTGFFVSLFIEMYGIPFTIYGLYSLLAGVTAGVAPESVNPRYVFSMEWGPIAFGMDLAMAYGSIMILGGIALICLGWAALHSQSSSGRIASSGIYAFSRHPQYLGFILVILGWIIGWPSPVTVLFGPVLIWRYHRLTFEEEREVAAGRPDEYAEYSSRVPRLI